MNFIVYDLEVICWEGWLFNKIQEIIEIGVILINGYGEVIGFFNKFIWLVFNFNLFFFCWDLIFIEQEYVDWFNEFLEVIEYFQDWVEIFDEDYLFCLWGVFDCKMFIQDCELYGMEWEWVEYYLNVKKEYVRMCGLC